MAHGAGANEAGGGHGLGDLLRRLLRRLEALDQLEALGDRQGLRQGDDPGVRYGGIIEEGMALTEILELRTPAEIEAQMWDEQRLNGNEDSTAG